MPFPHLGCLNCSFTRQSVFPFPPPNFFVYFLCPSTFPVCFFFRFVFFLPHRLQFYQNPEYLISQHADSAPTPWIKVRNSGQLAVLLRNVYNYEAKRSPMVQLPILGPSVSQSAGYHYIGVKLSVPHLMKDGNGRATVEKGTGE
ncbi:hypothetical protein GALMADRAFT_1048043 [Galerina marginata CBS 339.88]|uniref:Uncharacterized protein n=1 Tax=Galerina marginata (strain CBS 339.88) TaxID=685588 RepID=A0A067SN35_GALM3|nr:hypothetical protein GALMADRAFT_1048043 [Galerina marginata CBS 339.88]